ncbi:maltokinase N-terminal cap-like domain-containing protein [Brevibacterium paucivorans]|uniref:maltokinase N-terminal cap-like domain-containing protein n=1 Tax=Brevibacterium paucivorans TaxID=170994 RepID=UPI00321AA9E1
MAQIYNAELSPSKNQVIATVLGTDEADIEKLTSYRFDDPAGQIGMEVHIVRTPDGSVLQVPLVYRPEPLEDAEEDELITTMEHSVLGTRYVYLGMSDPVFAEALDVTISEERSGAEQFLVDGDTQTPITEGLADVIGTGEIELEEEEDDENLIGVLELFAELDLEGLSEEETNQPGQLIGTWEGQDTPVLLAHSGLVYVDDAEFDDEDGEEEDLEETAQDN